jgi:hypothetical protein
MNKLIKSLLIATLFFSYLQTIYAQDDKTVTLTVSGTGKTLEEAKTNALRSAIEQAFGAFISTKTEILNDNLVKDEIVSVSNGNIQKFEIISQVEIPNNGYAMTLNATVSISKLTSFAQSKGVSIEIKGGLFAANIIQQELNENAELISIQNILNTSNEILKKSFDYSIETKGNPKLNNGKYDIPLKISIKLNKNFYEFRKYFINSLSGLSMSESEIANYEEIKKPIGQLIIRKDTINFQEDLLKEEYSMNLNRNVTVVNHKNFDENLEKVFYFKDSQVNEVNSKKELKDRFVVTTFKGAESIPSILYKVYKNDLGYSKIFFRNESCMKLLNDYFDNFKAILLNFETSNNVELITGIDLIKIKKNNINNDFNVVLKNTYGYAEVKNIFKYYDKYQKNNFFDFDSQNAKFSQFIYRAVNGQKEYFANLLSILPIKSTSTIILASLSKFKEGAEITTIDFIDTKSLDEIKMLSEYKIKPKE